MSRTGVSLVEIITVMAVIAVLAFILTAVVSTARRSAEITSCASNQRAIGSASLLYALDHDGDLPGFFSGGSMSSVGHQNSLPRVLIPPRGEYLHDNTIFRCPQAMDRIYVENESTGWVNWLNTGQNDRSGYWHVYFKPGSTHHPDRANEFGRNDNILLADSNKVMMHCYYHPTNNNLSSHTDGSVNILRIDGSVQLYLTRDYDRRLNTMANFGWDR